MNSEPVFICRYRAMTLVPSWISTLTCDTDAFRVAGTAASRGGGGVAAPGESVASVVMSTAALR